MSAWLFKSVLFSGSWVLTLNGCFVYSSHCREISWVWSTSLDCFPLQWNELFKNKWDLRFPPLQLPWLLKFGSVHLCHEVCSNVTRHATNTAAAAAALLLTWDVKECLWNLDADLHFSGFFPKFRISSQTHICLACKAAIHPSGSQGRDLQDVTVSFPEHQVSAKPQKWEAVVCSPAILAKTGLCSVFWVHGLHLKKTQRCRLSGTWKTMQSVPSLFLTSNARDFWATLPQRASHFHCAADICVPAYGRVWKFPRGTWRLCPVLRGEMNLLVCRKMWGHWGLCVMAEYQTDSQIAN